MIGNILMLWKALSSGWQLKQSGFWNKLGAIAALLGPSLFFLSKWAAANGWIPAGITQEEVDQITYWAMQGTGILTAYWMRATNVNQGWQQNSQKRILRDLRQMQVPESRYEPSWASEGFSELTGGGPAPIGEYGAPVVPYGGVVRRVRQLHPQAAPDYFPGDDPSIDSFNR